MNLSRVLVGAALIGLIAAALAIRAPRLDLRPMHGDEANQAVKAAVLLESGRYRYDPFEHHGPSLYWLTLPSLWLHGRTSLAETTEFDFRIVPVVFGVGLIGLLWLVLDGLGRGAAVIAGLLTAISPAMVFYSRYYIQETLLVFFTLAALATGWRLARSRKLVWAVLCGACIGMMHATKETWVLSAAAAVAGGALSLVWTRAREGAWWQRHPAADPAHETHTDAWGTRRLGVWPGRLFAGLIAAGVVTLVLYSSFGRDWRGPLDSISAFAVYVQRGSRPELHAHPWYYYLELLTAFRPAKGFFWSEGFVVGLAVIGGAVSLAHDGLAPPQRCFCRFLTFYTFALTALYAAISYKTPWCLLSFFHGMILLAGVGAWAVLRRAWTWSREVRAWRFFFRSLAAGVVTALLAVGAGHLGRECYWLNFRLPADYRNPYVYAHTSTSVKNLARTIDGLAEVAPRAGQLTIHVVTPENYWPLPWYVRRVSPESVGYWHDPADWARDTAALPAADVVILTADVQDRVDAALRGDYNRQMMYGLRPDVLVHVYVRESLWTAFIASREQR